MRVRYITSRYKGSISEKLELKEEKAEEGKVEKGKGAMAEDEEETAESGEVEKEKKMHQCSECGKSYKYEHKLKHHRTWLCIKRAGSWTSAE